jgi:single-strand DNA-binding protein
MLSSTKTEATFFWLLIASHFAIFSLAWSLGIPNTCHESLLFGMQRRGAPLRAFSIDEEDGFEEEDLSDEELDATMGKWDEKIARFNTVHLTGRIGNNPEPKYFDDGKVVVNLSLATKRKYHSMERKLNNVKFGDEETDWYGLEIWVRSVNVSRHRPLHGQAISLTLLFLFDFRYGACYSKGQTAEFVAKFVDKGARVGVIGQLQVDTWSDLLETRAEAQMRRSGQRDPSFYTEDDEEDFKGPSQAGTGGFFDMM